MSNYNHPSSGRSRSSSERGERTDQISIRECVDTLVRRKKTLFLIVTSFLVVAVILSFILPKTYQSTATLLPVTALNHSDSISSLVQDKMGDAGGLLGGLLDSQQASSLRILASILRSRHIAEAVVRREKLEDALVEPKILKSVEPSKREAFKTEVATLILQAKVRVEEKKQEPVIKVSAIFGTPEMAHRVVAAYLDELQKFINNNALTLASRNRMFLESRLAEKKAELLQAGKDLAHFYNRNRISSNSSVDVMVDKPAGQQMAQNSAPLPSENADPVNSEKIIRDVPQRVYYEYLASQKEVLRSINNLLSSQFELAKMEEARNGLAFQVIDEPNLPVQKYGPKKKLIVIVAFFLSLIVASIYIFSSEYLKTLREERLMAANEERAQKSASA